MTKRKLLPVLLLLLTMMLTACGDGGKYEIKDGKVYYTYWTFSFGTQERELNEADAASFESIKNWLGRDDSHVWFKEILIEGADPASVKAEDYPLCRDKHDFYYKETVMHVADMESFRIIKQSEDDFWAVDSRYVYRDSCRIDDADPKTIEILEMSTAKDKNHVFYFNHILEDADPDTYEVMGIYSKDKSHVWYCGKLLEDADVATFEVDNDNYFGAHDKNGKFRNDKRIDLEE